MFHFHNDGCLAFMFSSFLMMLFLLPTKRRNKIRVRKGKFFDECVGMFSSFLMTLFLLQTERRNKIRVRKCEFFDECVGSVSTDALAYVSTDSSVGSDSLPLPPCFISSTFPIFPGFTL